MHPEDLRLLREIDARGPRGKTFGQHEGQSYAEFELEVLRLLELRKQGLITMRPEPIPSSRGSGEYLKTGGCHLTLAGRAAIAGYAE
jgi:hypothetical protein